MDTMCNVYTLYNVTIKNNKITKCNNNISWYLYNIGHTKSVW
jgi:hypothetical protein